MQRGGGAGPCGTRLLPGGPERRSGPSGSACSGRVLERQAAGFQVTVGSLGSGRLLSESIGVLREERAQGDPESVQPAVTRVPQAQGRGVLCRC